MDVFKMLVCAPLSPAFCKAAVGLWRFKAAAYFLLLSAVSGLGIFLAAYAPMEQLYSETLSLSAEKLRGVKIEGGKVVTPDGKDVVLQAAGGEPFAVASQNYIDANKTRGLLFAFEKDRLTLYMPDGSETFISAKDLGEIPDVSVMIPPKKLLLFALLPAIAAAAALFMNSFCLAIMTPACFIFSRPSYPLSLAKSAKLALFSLTPATLIDFVSAAVFGQASIGIAYALVSGITALFLIKKFAASENSETPRM